ncbi:MAG: right-handed parallel beta-helix repeat-containing protein, partial [Planctomycetota bacterium]
DSVDFGTYGLRIQISHSDNPVILNRSTETFTVPEDGNVYWVDDLSNVDDEYTPGAIGVNIGDNRNTGKLATAPKPNPVNLVRVYDLGAGDVVNIDTGVYPLIDEIRVSGSTDLGLGLDEGFTLRGPMADPTLEVRFVTAIPGARPDTLVEVNDADFVTLQNLTLVEAQRGLWVHNGSTNFGASYLTAFDHTRDAMRIETSAQGSILDHLVAYDSGDSGLYIVGAIGGVTDSLAFDNTDYGIYLSNPGNAIVEANEVYGNQYGLRVNNTVSGTETVVGNADLSLGRGNLAYANSNHGIWISSRVTAVGNTAYGHRGADGDTGIIVGGGTARNNLAFDNYWGITVAAGNVQANRVYDNLSVGIRTTGSADVLGNAVYSNPNGIHITAYSGSVDVRNNVIYDNPTRGVFVAYGSNHQIVNNTFEQSAGDAIRLQNVSNIDVRNNIFWIRGGRALNVADNSQTGFISDYNLFDIAGSGVVGSWQSADRVTLGDWRSAAFTDANSFVGDPLLVDPDGADDVLGFSNSGLAPAQIVDDGDGGFSVVGSWDPGTLSGYLGDALRPVNNVAGDDTAIWTFTGLAPGYYQVAATWSPFSGAALTAGFTLFDDDVAISQHTFDQRNAPDDFSDAGADWEILNAIWVDSGTLTVELADSTSRPVIADAIRVQAIAGDSGADDDFHLRSTYGRFEGSFSPVINPTTVLPVLLPVSEVSDVPADLPPGIDRSPAIDRGDAAVDFVNEPLANGGFVNLGAYGNTVQASKSPAEYVLVLSPNGGEGIAQGTIADPTPFDIRWRSDGFAGDVAIEIASDFDPATGSGTFQTLATVPAVVSDTGVFTWEVTDAFVPSENYGVRVSSASAPTVADTSDEVFRITGPITEYYVNDGDLTGDEYATAVGDDANDGLDPSRPKASIRAILETYELGPFDTIIVDTGIYDVTNNIVIDAGDAGVTIQGPVQEGHAALLDRGNTATGSYVFELTDADGVTLSHLAITGGQRGVFADTSSDSDNVTIRSSEIFGNSERGVWLRTGNDDALLEDNRI